MKRSVYSRTDTTKRAIRQAEKVIKEMKEANPHTEHWLVQEINSKSYVLYNLDTQSTWRVPKEEMALYLYGNERFGLKAMLRISEEVA